MVMPGAVSYPHDLEQVAQPLTNLQTSLTNMRDREPSGGERMALQEFRIHTASKTSHLLSGTNKSQWSQAR